MVIRSIGSYMVILFVHIIIHIMMSLSYRPTLYSHTHHTPDEARWTDLTRASGPLLILIPVFSTSASAACFAVTWRKGQLRRGQLQSISKPLENVWEEHFGSLARVNYLISGMTSLVTLKISTEKCSLATQKNAQWDDWLPCKALPSSKHNLWRYLPLPGRGSDQNTAPNYIKLQDLAKACLIPNSVLMYSWCLLHLFSTSEIFRMPKESLTSSITQPFFAWFPPFGPHPKCAVKECPAKKEKEKHILNKII